MQYKEFQVKYDDSGNGSLEGYASTWIRKADSYGDVVAKGAFSRTLIERWNGGKGIPLLWAHQMDNLKSFIGTAEAEEDEKGLHFLASFDDTEEAQRVRELYKDGRLSKFSFAFDVRDNGTVTLEDGTKANELRDLELFEISCVCVPANDDAGIVAVKANVPEEPEVKSGRRNSAKDADRLQQIIQLAQECLGEFDDTEEPERQNSEPKANEGASSKEQTEALEVRKGALLEKIKKLTQEVK